MRDVVSGGGGRPPVEPPSFESIENLAAKLQQVREAAATAREPTAALLLDIDGAIQLARDQRHDIEAAATPAIKVEALVYLANLLKAFPNSGVQDAHVFGRLMLDDVLSLAPPIAAVEIGCRRWRRKSKFLPAIAELMVEVKAAKGEIESAVEFIARLPALRARVSTELGKT